MLVATVTDCAYYAHSFPAIAGFGLAIGDPHAPWRYTLMSGVLPAIPLILIRPLLPESPAWQQKKAAGTLRRPSIAALFSPEFRRTTIVTTIMFAMAYGAAFGAIRFLDRFFGTNTLLPFAIYSFVVGGLSVLRFA